MWHDMLAIASKEPWAIKVSFLGLVLSLLSWSLVLWGTSFPISTIPTKPSGDSSRKTTTSMRNFAAPTTDLKWRFERSRLTSERMSMHSKLESQPPSTEERDGK